MKISCNIFYTYVLRCSDNSFYTGYTINPKQRLLMHNKKKASKYTRSRTPVEFVFIKAFQNKNKAMSFEKRIKLLTRKQKEQIISGQNLEFWDL